MAPIAVKFCARGDTRRAASQTDLLCRALICLQRLLADERATDPWVTWANRPLEDEIDAGLPRMGVEITPASALVTIEELGEVMSALHLQLVALEVDVHPHMVSEVARLA